MKYRPPRLVNAGTESEAYYKAATNEHFLISQHGNSQESAFLACIADAPPLPDWVTETLDDKGAAFVVGDKSYSYRDGDPYARRNQLEFILRFRRPMEVTSVDSTTAVSE